MSLESIINQMGQTGGKEIFETGSKLNETGRNWNGELPSNESKSYNNKWDGSLPKEQSPKTNWDGSFTTDDRTGNNEITREFENFFDGMDKRNPSSHVYNDAGVNLDALEKIELRGKEYSVFKTDIDPQLEGPDGITNKQRMSEGNAPYVDKDGKLTKIELHHHEQMDQGPLVELDKDSHNNNEAVLHPGQGKGEGRGMDTQWDARRNEYWLQRAEEFNV